MQFGFAIVVIAKTGGGYVGGIDFIFESSFAGTADHVRHPFAGHREIIKAIQMPAAVFSIDKMISGIFIDIGFLFGIHGFQADVIGDEIFRAELPTEFLVEIVNIVGATIPVKDILCCRVDEYHAGAGLRMTMHRDRSGERT